jgi:hypothetical protein
VGLFGHGLFESNRRPLNAAIAHSPPPCLHSGNLSSRR